MVSLMISPTAFWSSDALTGRHSGLPAEDVTGVRGLIGADGVVVPARRFTLLTQSYARMAFKPPSSLSFLSGVVCFLFFLATIVEHTLKGYFRKKQKVLCAGKRFGRRTG